MQAETHTHNINTLIHIHKLNLKRKDTHGRISPSRRDPLGEEAPCDGENMSKQGYIKKYTLKDVRFGGAYGQHRMTAWPFSSFNPYCDSLCLYPNHLPLILPESFWGNHGQSTFKMEAISLKKLDFHWLLHQRKGKGQGCHIVCRSVSNTQCSVGFISSFTQNEPETGGGAYWLAQVLKIVSRLALEFKSLTCFAYLIFQTSFSCVACVGLELPIFLSWVWALCNSCVPTPRNFKYSYNDESGPGLNAKRPYYFF